MRNLYYSQTAQLKAVFDIKMPSETEPKTKNLEVALDEPAVRRLESFCEEAAMYLGILHTSLEENVFKTSFVEEISEQHTKWSKIRQAFSRLASDLREDKKVKIIPLTLPQRLPGVALVLSSQWTGDINWQRLETLLDILYPSEADGYETSPQSEEIREALTSGQEVILKLV